ncbi:MAG: ABC transporter ATP-binding protein [Thermodesulfobacteriota bacterium]
MRLFKEYAEFGITGRRAALFGLVSVGAALFEGFGVAMFLPVLQYLEKDRDVAALRAGSRAWDMLARGFEAVGLAVGLEGLLALLVLLMFARVGMTYLRRAYVAWLTQDILHCIQSGFFSHYMRASLDLFEQVSTGRLVNLLTTEAQRVSGYCNGVFQFCALGLVVAGYAAVLLWLSPPMTLVALALLAISALVVSRAVNRQTREASQSTTAANRDLSFLLVELLGAVRLVKLSAADQRESERMSATSRTVRRNYYRLKILNAQVELILEPIAILAGAIVLYASFTYFSMSLAQIGVFMLVLVRLLPLSKELLMARQTLLSCLGSVNEVRSGLRQAKAAREPESVGGKEFVPLRQGIEVQGLRFTYPGKATPALDGVDLFIPAGRMTALVGPSGAGKSTLADCLAALRRPQQGRILFDGAPSGDFDLASLRRGMAFVSQDTSLLNDTVRANLAFPRPEATDQEIWSALERARAKEFVLALPKGLDTVLGERGVQLSGGQRQRLSLARALLEGAAVLILDEPTSALDSETEKDIQEVMDRMRREGRVTFVVIAHRLSTIRSADQIVVIRDGRVSGQGRHAELMASEDWYSKLNALQAG